MGSTARMGGMSWAEATVCFRLLECTPMLQPASAPQAHRSLAAVSLGAVESSRVPGRTHQLPITKTKAQQSPLPWRVQSPCPGIGTDWNSEGSGLATSCEV